MVVKSDGRRQPFDRAKILGGIVKACEKRPISIDKMEEVAIEVERAVQKKYDREVNSKDVGEHVMAQLATLDDVAYVRFASVYRQFRDVNQFMSELSHMFKKGKKRT
jgi:transcriptional repressor NrdR